MATNIDLRGIWTYRSFANIPGAVGDFNKLRVWEAELSVEVAEEGRISGFLGQRPETATGTEPYLTIEGEVVPGDPTMIRWRGKGRPGSDFNNWIYDYVGYLAPDWSDGVRQRPAIVGTVIRTVVHGNAPAGSVFSFVAVKSDFLEPRRVIPLAKPALDMLASAEHRYHHAIWHASRDLWERISSTKRQELRRLGWQPGPNGQERPSLSNVGAPLVDNGSGEDFLFMHRRMVRDVRTLDPQVTTWTRLPQPRPLVSFDAGTRASRIGNLDGYAVPPAWIVPGNPLVTTWLAELRKTSTLYGRFQVWEALYTDPRSLAAVTLGQLGSRIETTIHNWMHMRWASVPRDPTPDPAKRGLPVPEGRRPLDFDDKWLDPEYDYLGEFFSSHVNPVFWRLHGWVDDRIEDWFRAQEAVRPGVVERMELHGVQWFKPDGTWVRFADPWEGPRAPDNGGAPHLSGHDGHGEHGGHGGLLLDVAKIREALTVIYGPEPQPGVRAPAAARAAAEVELGPLQGTWFGRGSEF